MPEITEKSTVEEVAAIVSDALDNAGITATLSGGRAVTVYSDNAYLSRNHYADSTRDGQAGG